MAEAIKTALVVGATGVIGRGLMQHLDGLPDWHAIGISRRPPVESHSAWSRYLAVDLLDPADAKAKLGGLTEVTHVFYAAFVNAPDQASQVAPNLALLRNCIEALDPAAKDLQRVVLVEGTKWYGSHLGPFKTPAKEDDPRCPPPMFYHDQEDFLRGFAETRPWSWCSLRPQTVCGFSLGSAMNLMTLIGVYAAIRKHQGLSFAYPGKEGAYRALYQVADAGLLARGQVWAATAEAAADQAFNLTNGDFFRWQNLWPRLAAFFDMEAGPIETQSLTETMADKAPVWDEIVRRHGLQPNGFESLAAWPFGDYCLGCDYDVMSSTTKIRQAGFPEVVDSEEMFLRLFAEFREARVIP